MASLTEYKNNTNKNESIREDFGKIAGNDLLHKFTNVDWNAIEQPLTPFVISVIQVLKDFVTKGEVTEKKTTYQVMGESLYLTIRPKLEGISLVKPIVVAKQLDTKDTKKKGKNQQKKKGKTREDIIMESSLKQIDDITTNLITTFSSKRFETCLPSSFKKYVELVGIFLMYQAWYMTRVQPDKYNKEQNHETVLELTVGIHKFLNAATKVVGKSVFSESESISKTLLYDLTQWITPLNQIILLDGISLFDIAPRLLIFTKYDEYLPTLGIKPRKNQIDLINLVRTNIDRGFLISLKAMLSSGKTTSAIVCISEIVRLLNESLKSDEDRWQLLFVCNNNIVRLDAARIAWNGELKFGNATINPLDGTVKIINHNNTTNINRNLIIAPPDTAQLLLENEAKDNKIYGKSGRTILFLDEPTIGAENITSDSIKSNMSLLTRATKYTILSSATMCEFESIPNIVNNITARFPGILVDTVYSNEIQIGCDIKTFSNKSVIPYAGCKTVDELKNVIETFLKNPFLGRTFTARVAINLWTNMTRQNIRDIPQISGEFKDVNTWSLDNVRIICMNMLELLSKQSNSIISAVCNDTSLFVVTDKKHDDDKKNKNVEDNKLFTIEDVTNVPRDVTPMMFGTYQSWKFMGMNLVISPDPIQFAQTHFEPLLAKIKTKCVSALRLNEHYEQEMFKYQSTIDRLGKRVKREDERSKQIQEIGELKPNLMFPDDFQINTNDHLKIFAKGHIREINAGTIRPSNVLENIPYKDLQVEDWIVLLLYAGVGIVCPSKIRCSSYTSIVAEMASNGRLAFTIADKSIGYGTNNPYVRVFEFKDDTSSINTLFQDLARAGRVGQSWKAEAYIDDFFAEMIYEYIKDPNGCPTALIEPTNMEIVFNKCVQENLQREEERINLFKQKQIEKKQTVILKVVKKESIITINNKEINSKFTDDAKDTVNNLQIKQQTYKTTNSTDASNWRRNEESKSNVNLNNTFDQGLGDSFIRNNQQKEEKSINKNKQQSNNVPYIPPYLRKN